MHREDHRSHDMWPPHMVKTSSSGAPFSTQKLLPVLPAQVNPAIHPIHPITLAKLQAKRQKQGVQGYSQTMNMADPRWKGKERRQATSSSSMQSLTMEQLSSSGLPKAEQYRMLSHEKRREWLKYHPSDMDRRSETGSRTSRQSGSHHSQRPANTVSQQQRTSRQSESLTPAQRGHIRYNQEQQREKDEDRCGCCTIM